LSFNAGPGKLQGELSKMGQDDGRSDEQNCDPSRHAAPSTSRKTTLGGRNASRDE
jgi:hypothetical protein